MPRDEAHLVDMLIWARRAAGYAAHLDEERFLGDTLVQDAVIRCLQVVGDAAGRVSEDFKEAHPTISWFEIRGMRNRLVHEYGGTDPLIVFRAATDDCPRLIRQLESLLPVSPPRPRRILAT